MTVVISLACRKLSVSRWGTAHMPMLLVPHNITSSDFPPGLFPIGTCYPKPNMDGKAEEGVTHMDFTQENGTITSFTWSSKRGKKFLFSRTQDHSAIPLASSTAPFLRLPAEIRNNIYNLVYPDEELGLPPDRLDGMKDACRQLRQEIKGIYLLHAHISTNHSNFFKLIAQNESLIHGRMQHVNVVKGFQNLPRSVSAHLFPIIDFCKSYSHVTVRCRIGDWRYNAGDPVAFLRTGMIISAALRSDHKRSCKENKGAIEDWRAGRTVAQLNAPKMRLVPGRGHGFAGIVKFRQRIKVLIGKEDVVKGIMDAYHGSVD